MAMEADADKRKQAADATARTDAGAANPDRDKADARRQNAAGLFQATPAADRAAPRDRRPGELPLPDRLTSAEHTQAELKALAKREQPERFHSLIDESEILSVSTPAHYNREQARGHAVPADAPAAGATRLEPQRVARDTGRLSVVEMRLTQPLECGILHTMNEKTGEPHYGRCYGESLPAGRTQSEAREAHAIPAESRDKTHASWGTLSAGSVIVLSEQAPPEQTAKLGKAFSLGPTMPHDHAKPKEPTKADHTPPMSREFPARTFQYELARGQNPSEQFVAAQQVKLREDALH